MDTESESTVTKADLVTKGTSSKKGKNPIDLRPCEVCGTKASGFHFGAITCEACKVIISWCLFYSLQIIFKTAILPHIILGAGRKSF